MIGLPSALSVVDASDVSEDWAMLGYRNGTGPPGEGVLHTSGNVALMPTLLECVTDSLLALTVAGTSSSPNPVTGSRSRAAGRSMRPTPARDRTWRIPSASR